MATTSRPVDVQQLGRLPVRQRGRTGLIVATSMAAGLVVATALVTAPFIPVKEKRFTWAGLLGLASHPYAPRNPFARADALSKHPTKGALP